VAKSLDMLNEAKCWRSKTRPRPNTRGQGRCRGQNLEVKAEVEAEAKAKFEEAQQNTIFYSENRCCKTFNRCI